MLLGKTRLSPTEVRLILSEHTLFATHWRQLTAPNSFEKCNSALNLVRAFTKT